MTGETLSRRYLSLWLPFLTPDRWRLETQDEAQRPLIFVEKIKGVSWIAAADLHALALGLKPGLALTDARARCPDVSAVATNPAADAAFLGHLADLAHVVTPSVASDGPDGLALDITGCAHLFGGEDRLVVRLSTALRRAGVSTVRIAVAPTPDMARALARFARTSPCFATDGTLVRTLPLAALESAPEDTLALKRAGFKTIGDIASRPSVLFTSRFTPSFTVKLARTLGEEDRRIAPLRTPPPALAEHRCAEPVINADVIARIVTELAAVVVDELCARGEGGRAFETTFLRTDGVVRHIRVTTSQPTRDPAVIMRLYRERLDALADPLDAGFGFDLIRFEAVHTEPVIESQTTLDAHEDRDDRVTELIDRLGAMFGSERITRLQPVDSHIPERAQIMVPAAKRPLKWADHKPSSRPMLLYDRPHGIEVEIDANDTPMRIRWRRMTHHIATAHGPERITDSWWREPSGTGTRDYYRIESTEGQRLWIFRADATSAPRSSRWFLHGVFA